MKNLIVQVLHTFEHLLFEEQKTLSEENGSVLCLRMEEKTMRIPMTISLITTEFFLLII